MTESCIVSGTIDVSSIVKRLRNLMIPRSMALYPTSQIALFSGDDRVGMSTNRIHRSHDNWRQTKIVGMPIARNVSLFQRHMRHTTLVLAELERRRLATLGNQHRWKTRLATILGRAAAVGGRVKFYCLRARLHNAARRAARE